MRQNLFSRNFVGIFFLLLLTRLFPYINNPVPTGYDAGLYLLNFKTFPHIPQWVQLGFAPGLDTVLHPFFQLGLSPESIIIPLSIFSQIILFLSFYFVALKLFNHKAALFVVFMLSISAVQFRTFWYYYFNNTFAMAFLLIALYFFSQKRFIPAFLFSLLIGLFHLPTLLILYLVLILEFIFHKNQRLFYLVMLSLLSLGMLVCYLPTFKQTIQPFFYPLVKSALPMRVITGAIARQPVPYGGAFYSFSTFILLGILYIPSTIYGLYAVRIHDKIRPVRPFFVGFIVILMLVFSKFSFHQRFLIHLDIFIVFFGGLGLYYLYERFQKKKDVVDLLNFYMVILVIFIVGFIYKTSTPLINKSLFEEIKYFSQSTSETPPGYILSLSPEDPAWLMGYTHHKVIARNFGEFDRYWTSDQWVAFFSDISLGEKIRLLELLPQPLYIFVNDEYTYIFEGLRNSSCIKSTTLHFLKVECR